MTTPDWQRKGYPHIWMPYSQMATSVMPVPVVLTEGVYIELADGRRIIDGLASWWSACHGYNHPHIAAAVKKQLAEMPHVMFGGVNHEPAMTLARRLAQMAPGALNRVFFSDSGSVSVEVAMKMAVQYWLNRGVQGRHKFVTFQHGYHGDTTGAMSLCDPITSMHSHFDGFLLKQLPQVIPETDEQFAAFDQFLATHSRETAAVIIEPLVQGAGGMRFHSPSCLARIAQLCQERKLLLIADEIATGFGRTGSMFACEQADVVPDIMCLSKALTGGTMGLAVTLATDDLFAAFQSDQIEHALMHGPTFMANPLACAAANASLDLFESEPRLAQANRLEADLFASLAPCRTMPGVVDVRTKGAVAAVEVEQLHHLDWLRQRFLERGVWLRPFANAIYVTPALTMTPTEVSVLTSRMVNVIGEWAELPNE
ncbi:MAG: adenosylmethionine--8-amino-7-oxononanoate transaminase [Pirellulaceae bacterium]